MYKSESWFKWFIGTLIAILAAGGGIVALLTYFHPPYQPPSTPLASETATSPAHDHSTSFSNQGGSSSSTPIPSETATSPVYVNSTSSSNQGRSSSSSNNQGGNSSNAKNVPPTCLQGYVWREAVHGDSVCVTPETRDQAQNDNTQAQNRIDPKGAYGPDSCIQGYVWRGVTPDDHVCVTPEIRDQVQNDNAQAQNRVVP